MRCIRPIEASIASDGSITWNKKSAIPGLEPFEISCRKCLPCRLNTAREKAIRAIHEAQMHEDNIFLTLTYDDENLPGPKLVQDDIITFNKDLRNHLGNSPDHKIKIMYTGEYGETTKRPHWHSIIFNYRPTDSRHKRNTKLGEQVYESDTLSQIWGKGLTEFGSVTMDSAGYVARYAAKKLVHGKDQDHDFHPIHRTPQSGLGKTWIEKYWKQTFQHGYVTLPNGQQAGIPRYYTDWLKKHHPTEYVTYITTVREETIKKAEQIARNEEILFYKNLAESQTGSPVYPLTTSQVKHTILKSKFKKLQEHLKL